MNKLSPKAHGRRLALSKESLRSLSSAELARPIGGQSPPLPTSNKYRCGSATC